MNGLTSTPKRNLLLSIFGSKWLQYAIAGATMSTLQPTPLLAQERVTIRPNESLIDFCHRVGADPHTVQTDNGFAFFSIPPGTRSVLITPKARQMYVRQNTRTTISQPRPAQIWNRTTGVTSGQTTRKPDKPLWKRPEPSAPPSTYIYNPSPSKKPTNPPQLTFDSRTVIVGKQNTPPDTRKAEDRLPPPIKAQPAPATKYPRITGDPSVDRGIYMNKQNLENLPDRDALVIKFLEKIGWKVPELQQKTMAIYQSEYFARAVGDVQKGLGRKPDYYVSPSNPNSVWNEVLGGN